MHILINKKVLPCERKRHTASTRSVVLSGAGYPPPIPGQGVPHGTPPVLTWLGVPHPKMGVPCHGVARHPDLTGVPLS